MGVPAGQKHAVVREIQAKTLLARMKNGQDWFGVDYSFNVYRGCEHHCIYCDSRSECYGVDDFDVAVHAKVNAPELMERETARKHAPTTLGVGAMSDPYTPAETRFQLTRRVLEIAARRRLGINLQTKSDLVLRDLDLLKQLSAVRASVVFTLTTIDDGLAARIEPDAPSPSRRLAAMAKLAAAGIKVGTALMPVLPFLEDSRENVTAIAARTAEAGGTFLVPWMGVTLRDRQREHFYRQLDQHFPGVSAQYRRSFGGSYECAPANAPELYQCLAETCNRLGLLHTMREVSNSLRARGPRQPSLFEEGDTR